MEYDKAIIIGTAGRGNRELLSKALWFKMLDKAKELIPKGTIGISGGAAWSDHIAVELYRQGHLHDLILHLPSPINGNLFKGRFGSAGAAANYYHKLFSEVIGVDSIRQITEAIETGIQYTSQEPNTGLRAMFVRNSIVAKEADLKTLTVAFTWSRDGLEDSGTKHTWDLIKQGDKIHVSLHDLL